MRLLAAQWPLLSGFGVFLLLGNLLFHGNRVESQPLAFNHAKHIQSGLTCTDCHSGARIQARATLPGVATCMQCHETALGQSAEEAKLRKLAAAGSELGWIQHTRVPSHVYFSHLRHAGLAKIECATCHGPMETLTAPPRAAFREFTMATCMECHQQKKAGNDCNDCHR